MTSLDAIDAAHRRDLTDLVREVLRLSSYSVRPAARLLGVTESRLRALIGRLGMTAEVRARGPGRGRPRKSAKVLGNKKA